MTPAANQTTRRRPGRPRGSDSADVRRRIIAAGPALLGKQGFAATPMTQIAEAAGRSPTGLAHHFPSKRALLGAILEYRDEMDTFPDAENPGSPWACLDELVVLAGINSGRRNLVRLFSTLTAEAVDTKHPGHAWMLHHYDRILTSVTTRLERERQAGRIHPDTPCNHIAHRFTALMDGYQVQWLLDPGFDMAEALARDLAETKRAWSLPTPEPLNNTTKE